MHEFLLPLTSSVIKSSQFAYIRRAGSGTTPALVSVQNKILQHLDLPGAVRVLSIDFKKAFDKLPHSSILSSCRLFNVDPYMLRLIFSFLSNSLGGSVLYSMMMFLSGSRFLVAFHKVVSWAPFCSVSL